MALFDRLKLMWNPEHQISEKMNTLEPFRTGNTYEESVCDKPVYDAELSKQKRVSLLTPREHDLFLLLLEGYTLKECAKKLTVKYSTANTHMTGIYRKLEVNTRAELIIYYRGIVRMELSSRNE